MKVWQRVKAVFSNSYMEQYLEDWAKGNDVPNSFGTLTQETALKYSAFFACNRVLAETFASVPINEYKKDMKTGDRQATDDTGLYPILAFAPNDETSRFNFQESMMYQINLGGNFVAERLMGRNGKIAGFSQIPWQLYDIARDQDTRKLIYRIQGGSDLAGAPGMTTLRRDQVLHIPGVSTNGIEGMSLLSYAAGTIRLGSTYDTFNQKFYDNGATPTGVFEHEKFLKDEAYNRLKKDIDTRYTGLMNSGKPMLLEDDLKYKPLTINPIDAELLSSRKFQVEDICRFFRVQPHMIQHLEKSTNNNIEQQSLEFVMYTMLPHFKRVEDNINSQLLTPQQRAKGYYFEFNMATLLRGDSKAMAESFSKGIQWGYYSVNDVRRMLNLNKVEGGDTHLQPLNMVPLGTTPSDTSTGAAPTDDGKEDDDEVDEKITYKVNEIMDEAGNKGNI